MAVPSSGPLALRGNIALEVYGTATGNNISLGTMSDLAGFVAPDTMSEFYGYTSAVAPSVTTNNISNISTTSVTLNGNITSDGGANITERGFYFGTNSTSPTNNAKYTVGGTTGYYSNNRSGLASNTTYYCWSFATNSKGTTYGARVQSTTIQIFTPTYGIQYIQLTSLATSSNGPYGSFNFYVNKQYINPYTGGVVTWYSVNYANVSNTSGSSQTYYIQGPNNTVCSNATNRFNSYENWNIPGATVASDYRLRLTNASPGTMSNRVIYGIGPIGGLTYEANSDDYFWGKGSSYYSSQTTTGITLQFDWRAT